MSTFNTALFNAPNASASGTATLVSDLLYAALRIARVLGGAGHGPNTAMTTDAFKALNRMLQAWNIEHLMVFTTRIDAFPLPAKQVSTIGKDPTGVRVADFDVARPLRITEANLIFGGLNSAPSLIESGPGQFQWDASHWDSGAHWDGSGTPPGMTMTEGGGVRLPIRLIDDDEWSAIRYQAVHSTFPLRLYNDGAYPLSNLYFWPIPYDTSAQIEIYSWQSLGQFTDASDALILPDGYEEAITYNLAMRLATLWGTQLTPEALLLARMSKAWIKGLNSIAPRYASDAPGTGPRLIFNYRTGQ